MTMTRRLVSHSALLFAARIAGAGLMVTVQAVIARNFGEAALGAYLQGLSAINILAAAMPLGFQIIAAYFAVEYASRQQGALLKGFLIQAYLQVALVSGMTLVLMLAILPEILPASSVFVANSPAIWLMASAVALVSVSGSALFALRRPLAGFSADGILRPLGAAACVAFVVLSGNGSSDPVGAILLSMALLYLPVSLFYVGLAAIPAGRVEGAREPARTENRRWWRFAPPWILIALATDLFFDLHILLLSPILPAEQIAIYGVAARLFALAAFGVATVYSISLPDVFEAEANRDRDGFQNRILRTNLVAAGLSVLVLCATVLLGETVLSLFGPDFIAGSMPLTILCMALVVRSAFGPAALVISVHDRPAATLPPVLLGISVLVAASYLMVPALGLAGCALSALAAISCWSLAMWVTALRITGIDVSVFGPMFSALRTMRAGTAQAVSESRD